MKQSRLETKARLLLNVVKSCCLQSKGWNEVEISEIKRLLLKLLLCVSRPLLIMAITANRLMPISFHGC